MAWSVGPEAGVRPPGPPGWRGLLERYDVRARALLSISIPASVSLLLLATVPGAAQERWAWVLQLMTASVFLVIGLVLIRGSITTGQMTAYSFYTTGIFVTLALTLSDDLLRLVMAVCVLVPPLFACMFAGWREAVVHVLLAVVSADVLVEQLAPPSGLPALRIICVTLLVASPTTIMLILRHQLDTALRHSELLATTDPLTGLLNRRGMLDRSSPLIAAARRDGHRVAVLVADVDHFKQINDSRGHLTGDEVLRTVAAEVRNACREPDLVVRLGGEEIVVVMAVASAGEVLTCAERIRFAVARGTEEQDGLPRVTVSVGGVVGTPPHLLPGEEAARWLHHLMDEADDRMYEAKRGGRDRVVVGAVAEPQPV